MILHCPFLDGQVDSFEHFVLVLAASVRLPAAPDDDDVTLRRAAAAGERDVSVGDVAVDVGPEDDAVRLQRFAEV